MTLIGKCKLYFDTVIDLFQIKDQVVPPSKWKDLKTLQTTLPKVLQNRNPCLPHSRWGIDAFADSFKQ